MDKMNIKLLIVKFERFVSYALMIMMGIVILLSLLDVGWLIIMDVISPPVLILDTHELLDLFGMFLLVLIGLELLETIYSFHEKRIIRAEIIILVALMALARKIIILDETKLSSLTFLDIGVLILGLAGAYFLLKLAKENFLAKIFKIANPPNEPKVK
ncbi:MAG: phosphate-starvation-inducible PsiE family protein [Pseudomonadota bacterium]